MFKPLVSAAGVLLMFGWSSTGAVGRKCPKCLEGYYMTKDCSVSGEMWDGIQCAKCTSCSAARQDTLVPCSAYADSVCVNRTATLQPTMVAELTVTSRDKIVPVWIILTAVSVSVFLVLLLVLVFIRWSCTNRWKFMKLLPPQTCSPEKKDPSLPEALLQVSTCPA